MNNSSNSEGDVSKKVEDVRDTQEFASIQKALGIYESMVQIFGEDAVGSSKFRDLLSHVITENMKTAEGQENIVKLITKLEETHPTTMTTKEAMLKVADVFIEAGLNEHAEYFLKKKRN